MGQNRLKHTKHIVIVCQGIRILLIVLGIYNFEYHLLLKHKTVANCRVTTIENICRTTAAALPAWIELCISCYVIHNIFNCQTANKLALVSEISHRFFYLLRFHEKFLSLSICCCSKLNRVQKHHGKRRRLSLTNIPWGIFPFLECLHNTKLPHALLPIPVFSRKFVKLIFWWGFLLWA